MNDTLKTHKKKIIGGGAGVTAVGIILFFWQLGVGPSDIKALPELSNRLIAVETRIEGIDISTSSIMSEMAELRRESEVRGKEIATLTAQQEMTNMLLTEVRQDIKELLRR